MYSTASFDNCSELLIILYFYFQNEVNLTYPRSIKKVWFFLKYLQVRRFWVPPDQIFRIPYLKPSLVCLLKMKNSRKKKTRKSLYLVGCYLVMYLRCFDKVFRRPCPYFSNTLKVIFCLSDRYKIFTSDWLWIEVCQNACSFKGLLPTLMHCEPRTQNPRTSCYTKLLIVMIDLFQRFGIGSNGSGYPFEKNCHPFERLGLSAVFGYGSQC